MQPAGMTPAICPTAPPLVQSGVTRCIILLVLKVSDARVALLDCWRLRLLLPNGSYKPAQTYAMTEVQQQVAHAKQGSADDDPGVTMEGMFWWVWLWLQINNELIPKPLITVSRPMHGSLTDGLKMFHVSSC